MRNYWYMGMTHCVPMWMLPLWRRWMCRRGVHCFDEVTATTKEDDLVHTLVCDACQLYFAIGTPQMEFVEVPIRDERNTKGRARP